ncbi:MAG: HAMP domain-containing histidine kinase [Chamaesiphon sp.]|nr:HAMP domain-containing histidine kinase [Chamaesiphon sp.]
MQDSREIDYFGQRILQIVQPIAAGGDRREVLALLAQSVANNFAADGCWILQYLSPGVVRVAASACVNHRTNAISTQISSHKIPSAPTPTQWKMPLLPDYQVTVIETRDRDRVTGCLMVATKGVQWYRETKLVFQIVADYVSTALIEEDLQAQAQISQIYPQLHHHLTQAIVENQQVDRLFEIAVSDMVEALKLKRGLVLTLKTSDSSKQKPDPAPLTTVPARESGSTRGLTLTTTLSTMVANSSALTTSLIGSAKTSTQVQIVTTIDARNGEIKSLPPSFLLENSHLCKIALANAPNPTIFDRDNNTTSTDRLIFQDDSLPSIAMIPLMGSITPDRPPSEALWGWLVLQHDRSRHWHPVELNLLQCQIYQIALARIQSTSLKNARNAIASRTSQVQTSLQLQAKLHDAGRKRMDKLRQANELKDEFINTIGHELRTPLTSMSLAIKMLRQNDVDPARREQYLDILDDQCQREIKLINDLLKFQQLAANQLEFHPQQVELNQFISEQATVVTDRWSDNKGLELSLHLPSLSPQIETDADALKHIVEELLVNAGKFALPKTMIELWLTIKSDRAILKISNLSKPISAEDLPYLFERFRRGSGTTQQAIAGTGLGLALVKSMVDHIQGKIVVTSEAVTPSTAKISFTVTIPTVLELH